MESAPWLPLECLWNFPGQSCLGTFYQRLSPRHPWFWFPLWRFAGGGCVSFVWEAETGSPEPLPSGDCLPHHLSHRYRVLKLVTKEESPELTILFAETHPELLLYFMAQFELEVL